MDKLSVSLNSLTQGSGSSVLVIKKEYLKLMGVEAGKGKKLQETLIMDDGKFKIIVEAPE